MPKRDDPEAREQKILVKRLTLAQPKIWFFHPANERMLTKTKRGGRAISFMSHLRHMGQRRGVPDLIIETPTDRAPRGCRIEMKAPGKANTVRPDQQAWIDYYSSIGVHAATFDSADKATLWLVSLGYPIENL